MCIHSLPSKPKNPQKVHLTESYLQSETKSHSVAKFYNSNSNQILILAIFKEFWTWRTEIQFDAREQKPDLHMQDFQKNKKSVRKKIQVKDVANGYLLLVFFWSTGPYWGNNLNWPVSYPVNPVESVLYSEPWSSVRYLWNHLIWNNDMHCLKTGTRRTCRNCFHSTWTFHESRFELVPMNWIHASGNFFLTNTFYRVQ